MEVRKKLFGTNGIRGIPNEFLTTELAVRMGQSIAEVFNQGPIVMGKDTRSSGDMIFMLLQRSKTEYYDCRI